MKGDARLHYNVGIGTPPGDYNRLKVKNFASGVSGATVSVTNESGSGIAIVAAVRSSATAARLDQSGSGDFLHCYNHEATSERVIRLQGNGTVECKVLTITGGSDLAEPFASSEDSAPGPGMVLAIDPAQPGALRLASSAYDRCVAGIVSGAGGVNPGLTMRQSGSMADGEVPVALTGRAYCWADAAYGAIQPGDLLTTSDTPGHAMRASDPQRANGALLGKAMTGLAEGRGLVLVLVSLQ